MHLVTIVYVVILLAAVASYKAGKLTLAGAATGFCIALAIYKGAGITGIAMLAAFFTLATFATSHKKRQKNMLHQQKRDAFQVLANGGLAGLAGLLAFFMPGNNAVALIIIASALASATADTLSSEIGSVYGKRFYNIVSLKPDENGRDGVISIEGTVTGIAGSVFIAIVYSAGEGFTNIFYAIVIAGTVGNVADSILGAILERTGHIKNNEVNFLNTFIAAITCCLLLYLNLL